VVIKTKRRDRDTDTVREIENRKETRNQNRSEVKMKRRKKGTGIEMQLSRIRKRWGKEWEKEETVATISTTSIRFYDAAIVVPTRVAFFFFLLHCFLSSLPLSFPSSFLLPLLSFIQYRSSCSVMWCIHSFILLIFLFFSPSS